MLHSHSYCSMQKNVITSKVCFCIQGSRLYGRYDGTGKVWWRIIAFFARVLSIMRWESCSAGGEWECAPWQDRCGGKIPNDLLAFLMSFGIFRFTFWGILSVLPQHDFKSFEILSGSSPRRRKMFVLNAKLLCRFILSSKFLTCLDGFGSLDHLNTIWDLVQIILSWSGTFSP